MVSKPQKELEYKFVGQEPKFKYGYVPKHFHEEIQAIGKYSQFNIDKKYQSSELLRKIVLIFIRIEHTKKLEKDK